VASFVVVAACGRHGFESAASDAIDLDAIDPDADGPSAGDDAQVDAPPAIKAIAASGAWSSGASELRRRPAMSSNPSEFTFATWYKSSNTGTMMMCAGTTSSSQTFLWAGTTGGRPFFQHQDASIFIGVAPSFGGALWPYLGTWVHLVVAVDVTQADPAMRVRWWIDGIERTTEMQGGVLPQDHALHIGDAVVHVIGNKWEGGFDWTGSLAETYLILGHALDASAFVTSTPSGVRSIVYVGPIETESAYFEYATANAGTNSFAGQPSWTANSLTTSSDVPY
jgi:hypothetical protein